MAYTYEEVRAGVEGIGIKGIYLDYVIEERRVGFPVSEKERDRLFAKVIQLEREISIDEMPNHLEELRITRELIQRAKIKMELSSSL